MRNKLASLGPVRLTLAAVCLCAILFAWVGVMTTSDGYTIMSDTANGTPVRLILPSANVGDELPLVVIAHGFSGSRQLMMGFAHEFVQAGYAAVLFDFAGHGASALPFDSVNDPDVLNRDLAHALDFALEEDRVSAENVAVLGHSMGTGVILRAALETPQQFDAVIAVSPTGSSWVGEADQSNSPEAIPNLLLLAGELEAPFVANAESWIGVAGQPNQNFAAGTARDLLIVPSVEHISILFAPITHQTALDWLNNTFGRTTNQSYTDLRIGYYGLHLGAYLLLFVLVTPLFRVENSRFGLFLHPVGFLIAGSIAATVILFGLSYVVEWRTLGGLLVGTGLACWLFIMGVVWLVLTRRQDGGLPVSPSAISDVGWGLLIFAGLWLAFSSLAHIVAIPGLLIGPRLLRVPLLAALLLPWQLIASTVQTGTNFSRRLGWWFIQSIVLLIGLIATIFLVPALGFLILVLPLLPAILAITTLAGSVTDRRWPAAIGNSLFFAWILLSVFPLA